jgi:hypothetical protein
MASNDALVLSPRTAALEKQRETIVMVRWALILTCAYLMLLRRDASGPYWLGPLLVAAYLGSNLAVGRMARTHISGQAFKIGVAVLDTCFITASLWIAGQLSVELLLLCLGVLILAIAGLSLGVIAGVTIALSVISLVVNWLGGSQLIWQSSVLLRVPFLLGAALVVALLVEAPGSRSGGARDSSDDLLETLVTQVGQQGEAIRNCRAALAGGETGPARDALEDILLLNHQMERALANLQPEASRRAA